MTALALSAGQRLLEAHLAGTAVDAGGLLPDLQTNNSWTQTVDEVDPLELLEVQLCNATAPFLLISRLRPALAAAAQAATSRGRTSSTCRRWRASSPAATRAPATRTPTWPRPRSTC